MPACGRSKWSGLCDDEGGEAVSFLSMLFSPIRDFFKKGDVILLMLCLAASTFGLVLIYSATQYLGETRWIRFVLVQFVAIVLGVAAYILLTSLWRSGGSRCWPSTCFSCSSCSPLWGRTTTPAT